MNTLRTIKQSGKVRAIFAVLFFSLMLTLPAVSHAQLLPACDPIPGGANSCQVAHLVQLLVNIYNYLIGLAALVAIVFLIYGATRMLYWGFLENSAGELAEAKLTVRRSIGGFVIVLLAYVLVNTTIGFLGGQGINEILGSLLNPSSNNFSSAPTSFTPANLPSITGLDLTIPELATAFQVLDSNSDGVVAPLEGADTVPVIVRVLAAANTTPADPEFNSDFDLNNNQVVEPAEVDAFIKVYQQTQRAAVAGPAADISADEPTTPATGTGELPLTSWLEIPTSYAQEEVAAELVAAPSRFWQNPLNNLDVSGDGALSPLDLLILVNEVSSAGNRSLGPPPYYDVNADGSVTAADSKLITDTLNNVRAVAPIAGDQPFWQNSLNPLDVDGSGHVVPLDALVIGNYISKNGAGKLPVPPPYIDVDGDGSFSPIDIKIISEALTNQVSAAEPTAEINVGLGSGSIMAFGVLDTNVDGLLELVEVQPTFAVLVHTSGASEADETYVGAHDLDRNGLVEAFDLVSFADTYVANHQAVTGIVAATPQVEVTASADHPGTVAVTAEPVNLPADAHQLFATSIGFTANPRETLVSHPRFSKRYVPTASGFEAAGQACNMLAADAGLQDRATDNNWVALLSTPNLPIKEFLRGPVYNVRGELISQAADDLWHGTANFERVLTELGTEIIGNDKVWTGAAIEGGAHPEQNCGLWSADNSATSGRYGLADGPTTSWYDAGFVGCDNYARYYCASGHSIKPSLPLFVDVPDQDVVTDPFEVIGLSSGVTALDAGLATTCAVQNGVAKCWGKNDYGQLGNGTFDSSSVPVSVSGLTSGVTKLAVGNSHACALVQGGVQCWGNNSSQQLGNVGVTTPTSKVPVPVIGLLQGVTDLVAGADHTCALHQGIVKCWGSNREGQLGVAQKFGTLGNRTDEHSATPVIVEGIDFDPHVPDQKVYPKISSLSAGGDHTCAMTRDPGAVVTLCWGQRYEGHEGGLVRPSAVGPTTAISAGVEVNGGVLAIATGLYTNSISKLAAGDQYSDQSIFGSNWGNFAAQQNNFKQVDFQYAKGTNRQAILRQLDAGSDHACGVGSDGLVYCWATYLTGNSFGQLGGRHPSDQTFLADGSVETDLTPLTVSTRKAVRSRGIAGASYVATGGQHTCVIVAAGAVKCWGSNVQGQIGNGRDIPLPVSPPPLPQVPATIGSNVPIGLQQRPDWLREVAAPVQEIALSQEFNCGLVNTTLKCWVNHSASNANLAIKHPKDAALVAYSLPTTFLAIGRGGSDVSSMDFNGRNACVVQAGIVKCWGDNHDGQLGGTQPTLGLPIYSNNLEMVTVPGLPAGATQVVTGGSSCALVGGSVYCWGGNGTGALGDGTRTSRSQPRQVAGLSGVTSIARTSMGMCAIKAGGLWCWGSLMPGYSTPRDAAAVLELGIKVPTLVAGFESGVTKISSSWRSTCVIQHGGLKCWGDNSVGQLGVTGGGRPTPVNVPGMETGVTDVVAGLTTCALKDGAAWCWGTTGGSGMLGDGIIGSNTNTGANEFRATPQMVNGLESGVTALAGNGFDGLFQVCVVQNGIGKCWGSNRNGSGYSDSFNFSDFGGLGFGIWTGDKAEGNIRYSATPVEVWF